MKKTLIKWHFNRNYYKGPGNYCPLNIITLHELFFLFFGIKILDYGKIDHDHQELNFTLHRTQEETGKTKEKLFRKQSNKR